MVYQIIQNVCGMIPPKKGNDQNRKRIYIKNTRILEVLKKDVFTFLKTNCFLDYQQPYFSEVIFHFLN